MASDKKIDGKVILIIGGTGSFGETAIQALLRFKPKKIIVFSRDENKQHNMRNKYYNPILRFVIGDIRDKESLKDVMKGVDYVFHAAALKHVPSCEFFPIEAVKTNIIGSHNVIREAILNNVKQVVILSTDKAVYPINAMGMTKALMEKIMIAEAKRFDERGLTSTVLCGVRYGNVIYSRGSVIPYFIDLIKQKKPLPVTNPSMTRFLMPLSQSIDLVLYALKEGRNGHIYIRKAPACTLETLAKALCIMFSHKAGIIEIGVRAGEKIHEVLMAEEESFRAYDRGNYYVISPETQHLDYDRYFSRGEKIKANNNTSFTSENTIRLNVKETINLLNKIPEIKKELKNIKGN